MKNGMKKILIFVLTLSVLFVFTGCSNKVDESNLHRQENDVTPEVSESTDTVDNETLADVIRMVNVGGKIYLDTGKESVIEGRCGVFDGRISSTVEENEKPTADNQSNFGIGYVWNFFILCI